MKAKFLLMTFILGAALGFAGLPALAHRAPAPGQAAAEPTSGRWELIYEEHGLRIDPPGERALVVDRAGVTHAVYGGSGLYYERRVGDTWQHEVADPAPAAGNGASIAVDLSNQVHVCYLFGEPAELRHAWRDAAGWHRETVTTAIDSSRRCSIAAGAGTSLGIAFRGPGGEVIYAYRDTTSWHRETLATGLYPDSFSLLIDGTTPLLAVSGQGLYYFYRTTAGWEQEKVADVAYSASIAAGGGILRIAYPKSEELALATRSGGRWQSETVATGEGIFEASLAVDAGGNPHVAYYKGASEHTLMIASRDSDGWHSAPTGSVASRNTPHVSLALRGETPVLAECKECDGYYPIADKAQVDVTVLDTAGATTETLAAAYFVGQKQKLAMQGDGTVHLVYSDSRYDNPLYLRQDNGSWKRETIAGASVTDALALDSHGRPHIAFADAQGVHHGAWDGSVWHFEAVAPSPAADPALALDAQDGPHLAWTDDTGLQLGWKTGGQWSRERAAAGSVQAPAIGIDASGTTDVSYSDASDLRYAYKYDGRWFRAYPAPLRAVTGPAALVLDTPGASYLGLLATCYMPNGDVLSQPGAALRMGREWRFEELGECSYAAGAASLAASGDGEVRAAYGIGAFPYELRYARRVAGQWQAETVYRSERQWDILQQLPASLALDGTGRPTISHYNPDTLGLAVYRWVEAPATPTPTPGPTQTPSLTCLTPTPAAPYTGVPPASGAVQRQVVHCAEDAYLRVDTDLILYDAGYVRMGARNDGSIPYVSAFLFRDVRVPRGADITSARLRLQPELHSEGTTVAVSIAGELHGQSGDFNPNNWWPQDRPRTVARVGWTVPATLTTAVDSPDIAAIVEEIVALPGWKPGNNIAILVDAMEGTNAWINWHAYDGKPAAAAQLSLSYQPK